MKRSTYLHGKAAGVFYNATELLAHAILKRRLPKDIAMDKGVRYGEGKHDVMNFIYPKERCEKLPLLLYIHGGGFISGLYNMRNTYCTEYVKNGFVAASIDYDYAPSKVFPYQLKQCFRALDHIFDNAEKYDIDTSKIILGGESAGGFFIFYLAAIACDNSLLDKLGIEFRHKDEFRPRAIVSICGAFDMERLVNSNFPDMKLMVKCFTGLTPDEIRKGGEAERIKLLSPRVTKDFPPVMLIYAKHDALKSESLDVKEKLIKCGVPFREYEGTGIISMHAFPIATICKKGRECFSETLDFVSDFI